MSTVSNQLRMSMLNINSELIQNAAKVNITSKNIQPEQSLKEQEEIYAQDGDFKYDKAMDYNEDGVVTYDEYMRYCEENAVAQYSEHSGKTIVQHYEDTSAQIQSIRPLNIGKALSVYSEFQQAHLEASVESEA